MTAGGQIDFRKLGTSTSAAARRDAPDIPRKTQLSLLPGKIVSACYVRRSADGVVELQRRAIGDAVQQRDSAAALWEVPTPALVAVWARDLGLDEPTSDDPFAPRLLADADVAEAACARVVEIAEAALAPTPVRTTTATLERAVARRFAARRKFWVDAKGNLHAAPVDAPANFVEDVTVESLRAAGRTGLLQRTEPTPDWAVVLRELRALAGLPAAEVVPAGTGWLRRRSGVHTHP